MASGVSRRRLARTGAPASASTAFTPTVRSSVLLPDMFDPLTTSTDGPSPCPSPASRTSFRTLVSRGISGCPSASPSKQRAPVAA